jgi:hypothetical protein
MDSDHGFVEVGIVLRMRCQVLEQAGVVDLAQCGVSGLQAVEEIVPGLPLPVSPDRENGGASRARRAAPQGRSKRCQCKSARPDLCENTAARERTQQAIERGGVRARGGREIIAGARPGGEKVRYSKVRRRVDRAGCPDGGRHLDQRNMRGRLRAAGRGDRRGRHSVGRLAGCRGECHDLSPLQG